MSSVEQNTNLGGTNSGQEYTKNGDPGFNYIYKNYYENQKPDNLIVDLKKTVTANKVDTPIYISKISPSNPYYIHYGSVVGSTGVTGMNPCGSINNKSLLNGRDRHFSAAQKIGEGLYNIKTSGGSTIPCLVGCVGWASGRMVEVWELAKKIGWLYYDNTKNSYVVKNSAKTIINGVVDMSNPLQQEPWNNHNAGNVGLYWPTTLPGWYKKSVTPGSVWNIRPGCILVWRDRNSNKCNNGHPGHVAFVEAVYNIGTSDEFIIISESGKRTEFLNTGVNIRAVKKHSDKYPGEYYVMYDTYKLHEVLYSPVTQLANHQIYYAPEEESSEVITTLAQYNSLATDCDKLKILPVGTQIKIMGLGNTKKDGSGNNINYVFARGYIKTYDANAKNPYGIALQGNSTTIGYYERVYITDNIHWGNEEI